MPSRTRRHHVNLWCACVSKASPSSAEAPLRSRIASQSRSRLTDTGYQAKPGEPTNRQIGPRGTWHVRRRVETAFSRWTTVCHGKTLPPRVWAYVQAHVGLDYGAFNGLAQWTLEVDYKD